MGLVDLLLLTDGRAPIGAYAHSYGLEPAVLSGDVDDVATLHGFVAARLATAGRVEAHAAAAVHHRSPRPAWTTGVPSAVTEANDEVDARLLAPATRSASRALGRHLLRMARRTWPDRRLDALATGRRDGLDGWHQPVVLGVVGAAIGTAAQDVATASLYGLTSGLASAGVRLLGLDPVEVHAVQSRLAGTIEELAHEAAGGAARPLTDLPATGTPLADVRVQHHADDPAGRLFAS